MLPIPIVDTNYYSPLQSEERDPFFSHSPINEGEERKGRYYPVVIEECDPLLKKWLHKLALHQTKLKVAKEVQLFANQILQELRTRQCSYHQIVIPSNRSCISYETLKFLKKFFKNYAVEVKKSDFYRPNPLELDDKARKETHLFKSLSAPAKKTTKIPCTFTRLPHFKEVFTIKNLVKELSQDYFKPPLSPDLSPQYSEDLTYPLPKRRLKKDVKLVFSDGLVTRTSRLLLLSSEAKNYFEPMLTSFSEAKNSTIHWKENSARAVNGLIEILTSGDFTPLYRCNLDELIEMRCLGQMWGLERVFKEIDFYIEQMLEAAQFPILCQALQYFHTYKWSQLEAATTQLLLNELKACLKLSNFAELMETATQTQNQQLLHACAVFTMQRHSSKTQAIFKEKINAQNEEILKKIAHDYRYDSLKKWLKKGNQPLSFVDQLQKAAKQLKSLKIG